MKEGYELSTSEGGKVHRRSSKLRLPIYLDDDILPFLRARADEKGITVSELANDLLRREIDLVEEK